MTTPNILQVLLDNKEALGIATSAVGVVKTAYDVIQSRTRASTRDRLLLRIQGLVAARQAMSLDDVASDEVLVVSLAVIKSQLSDALIQFSKASEQVREKQIVEGRLGLLQRVFLLYKPMGLRAWPAHIITWLSALCLFLIFFASWFPNDDEAFTASTFVQNWKDLYIAFLLFFGIFLLVRLWGVSERKRYLQKKGAIPAPRTTFRLTTFVALLYAACGVAFLIAAVALARNDAAGAIKFGIFGAILAGCGPTLSVWGKLRERKIPLTTKRAALLFLPGVLLTLVIVFDLDGIVIKGFGHDILGYWHNWIDEPWVPFFFLPVAALPLYAGIQCLRSTRS